LSNLYDAKLIATPAYRQQMATCIVQAIGNYRRAVAPAAESEIHAQLRETSRRESTAEISSIDPREPRVITSGN
jgi:N-acetylmuramoyl-L-alanine amidase